MEAGKRYGRLVVLETEPESQTAKVVCECGRTKYVAGTNLESGAVTNCGCLVRRGRIREQDAILKRYRKSAADRGLEFSLEPSYFFDLLVQPCEYCGRPAGGVDRMENDRGYVDSNAAPCCWVCNRMKNVMGYRQFLDHVALIAANQSAKEKTDDSDSTGPGRD